MQWHSFALCAPEFYFGVSLFSSFSGTVWSGFHARGSVMTDQHIGGNGILMAAHSPADLTMAG
jgi:hypothetical protein